MNERVTDVVVVGGGVIGLSAALALAERDVNVTVIDKGPCGRESSWSGAGVLRPGSWQRTGAFADLHRYSLDSYPAFVDKIEKLSDIVTEYERGGAMALLDTDQKYRMAASEVRSVAGRTTPAGSPILELLSPDEARKLEPAINPGPFGVKRDCTAAQVRNSRLLQALIVACRALGATIIENHPVEDFVMTGSRVHGVQLGADRIACGHVVLSAGAWSGRIGQRLQGLLPVYPVRGQIVLLGLPTRILQHVIQRRKCYVVPRRDGKMLVGITLEPEAGFEKITTAAGVAGLLREACDMAPALGQAEFLQTWAGLRPGTPDGRPYLGPVPGFDGLIAATGHYRIGLAMAPATAEIVRDLVLRGQCDWDLTAYTVGRANAPQLRPRGVDDGD